MGNFAPFGTALGTAFGIHGDPDTGVMYVLVGSNSLSVSVDGALTWSSRSVPSMTNIRVAGGFAMVLDNTNLHLQQAGSIF
jgi:hypothetical protein